MKLDAMNIGMDAVKRTSLVPNNTMILSEHLRQARMDYFSRLDGCSVTNLHEMVLSEVERPLIQTVLEHCGHNQSKAAQVLGLSRSTLRKKMTQYGLE